MVEVGCGAHSHFSIVLPPSAIISAATGDPDVWVEELKMRPTKPLSERSLGSVGSRCSVCVLAARRVRSRLVQPS